MNLKIYYGSLLFISPSSISYSSLLLLPSTLIFTSISLFRLFRMIFFHYPRIILVFFKSTLFVEFFSPRFEGGSVGTRLVPRIYKIKRIVLTGSHHVFVHMVAYLVMVQQDQIRTDTTSMVNLVTDVVRRFSKLLLILRDTHAMLQSDGFVTNLTDSFHLLPTGFLPLVFQYV